MSKENEITAVAAGAQEHVAPSQRFDFGSYGQTRRFLDQTVDLVKRENYYPHVGFGEKNFNISIDAAGQADLSERKFGFIADKQASGSKVGDRACL